MADFTQHLSELQALAKEFDFELTARMPDDPRLAVGVALASMLRSKNGTEFAGELPVTSAIVSCMSSFGSDREAWNEFIKEAWRLVYEGDK
jgi:hypothetical protein